jgi:hypothetical protein
MGEALREVRSGVPGREIRRISPEDWSVQWPNISESLDRIPQFWSDYWTKEYINWCVVERNWQAWGFGVETGTLNVVVLTHVVEFPANRFLQIPLAWGNHLEECLPLIEAALERFAIEAECDICEIAGRVGWERKLKGFRRRGVVLCKRVPRIGVH